MKERILMLNQRRGGTAVKSGWLCLDAAGLPAVAWFRSHGRHVDLCFHHTAHLSAVPLV